MRGVPRTPCHSTVSRTAHLTIAGSCPDAAAAASDRLLFDCGKESVVLYVGHENSAQKVYHRVGFAGLCGDEKVEGVEDSLELGFIGSDRGHW